MSVVSGVAFLNKRGNERDKKYYGACFAPLIDFPYNYRNTCKEILYIYYPLAEQEKLQLGLSDLKNEQVKAILYDIYHYMNLQPFLYNTYEDCIETGLVKVRADYDGRFVFNTLSFFRQFYEYPGYYYFYVLYRENGASPLEAFVLASSFRVGYDFRTKKEDMRRISLTGHSATDMDTWAPKYWKNFIKGMNPDDNKGDFFSYPQYFNRIMMLGIEGRGDTHYLSTSDKIKYSFHEGGVPSMIETWREIANG